MTPFHLYTIVALNVKRDLRGIKKTTKTYCKHNFQFTQIECSLHNSCMGLDKGESLYAWASL